MSVYKRGDVYWYEFRYKGRRHRESTKASNRAVALQIEAAKRNDLALGHPHVHAPGFEDFMREEFVPWSEVQNRPNTYRRYKVSSKPLIRFFGGLKVDQIDAGQIERFKMRRLKQCSAAGVNRDMAVLRYALNFAIRQGYLRQNPVKLVRFLREGPGMMRIISIEEEGLFLQHAPQPLSDIAVIMLETGMRPKEVYALKRENVDLAERYVFVTDGKSRFARRTIPLTQRACEVFQSLFSRAKVSYLFPHRTAPNRHMVICRSHVELCRKLKLEFRLYDLRHTFGSRAAMAGVDLPTLKELMGHSAITMTMKYVHPTPEHKRGAMAKLDFWRGTHKSPHAVSMSAA